jgi:hypothetical protein
MRNHQTVRHGMHALLWPMAAFAAANAAAEPWRNAGGFEDASITVETNATDGDTEILINAKPLTDLGLKSFRVISPHWREVAAVFAPPRSLGLREIRFETPEPPGNEVLDSYPEGTYLLFGTATNGQRFFGAAELSHAMPGATVITAPVQGQVVSHGPLSIRWIGVPDAAQYVVEVQNESADPEQTLTVNLPAGTTDFTVPPSFVVPGGEYQVAVATIGANGNFISVELTFSVAE